MALHYEGPLGSFDYDPNDWSVTDQIKWVGGNKVCNLPKGVVDCTGMFAYYRFNDSFVFGDFDTSDVVNMSRMFLRAKFPNGFKLGGYVRHFKCPGHEPYVRRLSVTE